MVFVQKAIIMLLLDIKLVWKCIFPPEIFISLLIFFAPYMDFRNQSLYQVSVSLAICSINLYHKTNFRNIFFKVLRCILPSWMSKCFLQMLNQIKYFFIKIFVPIWTLNAKKMHPKSLNYFPLCTRGQLRGPEGPYPLSICTWFFFPFSSLNYRVWWTEFLQAKQTVKKSSSKWKKKSTSPNSYFKTRERQKSGSDK